MNDPLSKMFRKVSLLSIYSDGFVAGFHFPYYKFNDSVGFTGFDSVNLDGYIEISGDSITAVYHGIRRIVKDPNDIDSINAIDKVLAAMLYEVGSAGYLN